ncbi:uncharacterized protein [Diadema antillarum]|uniref:uncharacterized protein n=1 Tax=Diadema antillarum TaxID=105358 RepID=UPI003A85A464
MRWYIILHVLVLHLWRCSSENVGDIRLLNGDHIYEGRVEVFLGSRGWYGTCDEAWSMDEATVVCRQLGYPGAIMGVQNAGRTRGIPLARTWHCTGDEETLLGCPFVPTYICLQAAGVICHGPGYLGCYHDEFGPLTSTLSENYVIEPDMTVERCRSFCMSRHLRIVGLKNGNECYCGLSESELANHARLSDAECQAVCPGNNKEVCGGVRNGTDKLSVFDVNLGECVNPGVPEHGRQLESSYKFGDIVLFECHPGYELVGVPAIQCVLASGGDGQEVMWSTSIPSCSKLPSTSARPMTTQSTTLPMETTTPSTTSKSTTERMTTTRPTTEATTTRKPTTEKMTTTIETTTEEMTTTETTTTMPKATTKEDLSSTPSTNETMSSAQMQETTAVMMTTGEREASTTETQENNTAEKSSTPTRKTTTITSETMTMARERDTDFFTDNMIDEGKFTEEPGNKTSINEAQTGEFSFFDMISENLILISIGGTFLIILVPVIFIVIFKKACKRRRRPNRKVQIERSIDYQLGSEVTGFTYEPLATPRPRYQSFRKGFKRFSKRPWSDREEESSDEEL